MSRASRSSSGCAVDGDVGQGGVPGYWMAESSGVLRLVVPAFLRGDELGPAEVVAMRAYLQQWIKAGIWEGPEIPALRADVDNLRTTSEIRAWIARAVEIRVDPL